MTEIQPFEPGATPQQLLAQLEATGNLTPAGLILPANLPLEMYENIGALLFTWGEGWRWAVGDWLIQGVATHGEAFYQVTDILGISVRSRQQYMRVSERIPPGPRRRVPELRWTHHRAVCAMDAPEADKWLQHAIDKTLTRDELNEAIAKAAAKAGPQQTGDGGGEPQAEPTTYVVERVLSAAERVYAGARLSDDPEWYLIGRREYHDLRDALGVVE